MMKSNSTKNMVSKITTTLLALTVLAVSVCMAPQSLRYAKAAETLVASDYYMVGSTENIGAYWSADEKTVPAISDFGSGYRNSDWVFAGWFSDSECETAWKEDCEETLAYAKFVPAEVMNVAFQVLAGTTETGYENGSTKVRLVSTVDSDAYNKVGFKLAVGKTTGPNVFWTNKVYTKIVANVGNVPFPIEPTAFNENSKHFVTVNVSPVAVKYFETALFVTPCWETLDGTVVDGPARFARVEDSYEGILNVPVRLDSGANVAAGLLKVSYDADTLEYVNCDAGTVFEEMEAAAKVATVTCAGNVKVMNANTKADGVYMNLRFKLKEGKTITDLSNTTTFEVSGESFCDLDEADVAVDNGGKLKECVLALCDCWKLPDTFKNWVKEACVFCSTLVDRIVTGYPRGEVDKICAELGYEDRLVDVGEPFGLWVIESDRDISEEFPLDKAGLPVIFTDNQKPYRERKVRVLNGAHTSSVLAGYLYGLDIVRDCMQDEIMGQFIRRIVMEEIVPEVPLPLEEVKAFAASVFERFENPFIDHQLLSISLNSVSKWKARVLPTFKDYYGRKNELPEMITFSLAALLAFYSANDLREDGLYAKRADGSEYVIHDDREVLEFFAANSQKACEEFVHLALTNEKFWGEDLTAYAGLEQAVTSWLIAIKADTKAALCEILKTK